MENVLRRKCCYRVQRGTFKENIKQFNTRKDLIDLHYMCGLCEYLKGEKDYYSLDFWWNIDNDFDIFFGEEKANMILEAQRNMREESIDQVPSGDWDKLSEYYFLVNQDLSEEARYFLKSKKSKLIKRLVRAINTRIDSEQN